MPHNLPLPAAPIPIVPMRGKADCAIACLAMLLRRDYEEVLAAAGRVCKAVWRGGLSSPEMIRVARAFGMKVKFSQAFDPELDTGILWVTYRDRALEHVIFLAEGKVFEVEDDPVSMWDYDEFVTVQNVVPKALIKVVG